MDGHRGARSRGPQEAGEWVWRGAREGVGCWAVVGDGAVVEGSSRLARPSRMGSRVEEHKAREEKRGLRKLIKYTSGHEI